MELPPATLRGGARVPPGREQFSRPVASFQLIRKRQMMIEIDKGMLLALGRMKDAETPCVPSRSSIGKLNNVREAIEIARGRILGGNGVPWTIPSLRHMNNLEAYVPAGDRRTLIISNAYRHRRFTRAEIETGQSAQGGPPHVRRSTFSVLLRLRLAFQAQRT